MTSKHVSQRMIIYGAFGWKIRRERKDILFISYTCKIFLNLLNEMPTENFTHTMMIFFTFALKYLALVQFFRKFSF